MNDLDMNDGSSSPAWGILVLILLLWLNGVLYGFAAAVRNLSENELGKKAQEGNKKAQMLLRLIEKPQQYINFMPLLVSATGILAGLSLLPFVAELVRPYISHWIAVAGGFVFLVIFMAGFGILTFRRIGTYNSESFAYRYVKIVHFIVTLFSPVTVLVTWAARIACLPFGIELDCENASVTEEEIISIVDEAHEQGVIEENEAEMIQNIISFNETSASDIMTHRKNVIAFSEDTLLSGVVDVMLEEGNTRYPVYREDIDNIIGVVTYKDVMKFMTRNSWAKFKPLMELPGLIRTAVFIPETRAIGDLFHMMQAKKEHMAIVVDEYGQTAGIVSMEDILEEIVGEIQDEYDDEEVSIETQKDNSVLIDGLADIEDVEEKLGIDFGELEFETLNGYLTSMLGHIPTEKDLEHEMVANGYRFKILSLGNKTIDKVRAEIINDKETEGERKCQDIQNLRI